MDRLPSTRTNLGYGTVSALHRHERTSAYGISKSGWNGENWALGLALHQRAPRLPGESEAAVFLPPSPFLHSLTRRGGGAARPRASRRGYRPSVLADDL